MSYTEHFYTTQRDQSRRSAEVIIPEVLSMLPVESACDVGCGVGTWANVLIKNGVKDVVGIDGDYVTRALLEIPQDSFLPFDLRKPLRLDRQFDLVISLEVAEHLEEEFAAQFIESLTILSSVILFSAAIPFQGGVNHFNEQWQDYWADLFEQEGYVPIDCIRKKFWRNPIISPHYASNILMYCDANRLDDYPNLAAAARTTCKEMISVVNPRLWQLVSSKIDYNLRRDAYLSEVARALPHIVWRAIKNRL